MKKSLVILAAVFLGASLGCFAQQASIVGTVMDTSGAVIPGAKVTVQNPAKGFVRQLVTNSVGAYVAADIPIGGYVVSAEAPGFKRTIHKGVILRVNGTLRVNLRLEVGAITQEVSVQGQTLHVQTDTAQLSRVITGNQVRDLDLNGRNFASLALLVPGASPDYGIDPSSPVGDMAFNGMRHRFTNFMVNGIADVDGTGDGGLQVIPSVDSIAEFRITTANYGAEYGEFGGAQVAVATKSGTQQFHGDAYDYVRNTDLEANPWFQNRIIAPPGGHAPKSALHYNDFGYTLGGPVFIPRHYNTGKTKTFFFWSQEWHRYRQPEVINAPVPSSLMRQGDFSQCDPASGNYNPVIASGCTLPSLNGVNYDAIQQMPGFNTQAFTNGTDLLNAFVPLPNNGPIGYISSAPSNINWRQDSIRVDENFTPKTTLSFNYIHQNDSSLSATGNGSTYDSLKQRNPDWQKLASVSLMHIFAPTFLNRTTFGATNDLDIRFPIPGPTSVAGSIDRPSNFVMNHFFAVNASNPFLPGLVVGGGVPFSFNQDTGTNPVRRTTPNFHLLDDATWVHGNHSLKFGFMLQKYEKNESLQSAADTNGTLTFNAGGALTTGNALADMFLGRIQQYTESEVLSFKTGMGVPIGGYGRAYWRSTQFEPYFEDDWRATHKLTLNLGVRYAYFVPQHDIQNPTIDNTFVPSLYNPAAQAQLDSNDNLIPGSGFNYTEYGNGLVNCARNGIPEGCTSMSEANVAPRFGFAYDPFGNGTTVVRGGYGIFYSTTSESAAEGMGGNPPSALSPSGFNILGYDNIVPGALPPFSAFLFVPLHQTMPSTQQWSLGIQHMFRGNNLLMVTYVGTVGHHLTANYNFNQIPIGVGIKNAPGLAGLSPYCDAAGNCNVQQVLINQAAPPDFFVPYRGYTAMEYNPLSANSNYNALQAEFTHALGHGLMLQASYTWSHELDDTSGDGVRSNVDDSNLHRWYGSGRFSRSQMLVMNYIYNLPFFTHSANAFARQALGGWRVSGITSFYSGARLSTYGVCGINGFSSGIGENVQCNTVGAFGNHKSVFDDPEFGPTVMYFNPNTITQPTLAQLAANHEPGMFGYMGRNTLVGPGQANWDLALLKDFKLPWLNGENSTLQFRLETFNTFNTPEWNGINFSCSGAPNNDGSPAFGRPCGGTLYNLGNGEVNSTFNPRIAQLALKFIF